MKRVTKKDFERDYELMCIYEANNQNKKGLEKKGWRRSGYKRLRERRLTIKKGNISRSVHFTKNNIKTSIPFMKERI